MRSVRGRLVLLAVLMAAPLALSAAALFAWSYQRERAAAEMQLRATAQAVALVIDRQLGQAETFLKALSTSPSLATGDFRAFDTQAREAARGIDGWVVLLELPSGQQVINTRLPPDAELPQADLSEIRPDLEAGRSAVTNLIYGPVARQPVIGVNVPVIRDGRTVYTLAMGMSPSALSRVLSDQGLPEGWVGTILDRADVVVARSRSPERYVGKPPSPSLIELLKTSVSGSGMSTTLEGGRVVAAWSRSPSYGWTFAVGVPADRLAATAWRSAIITMLLGMLALAAGAVAAVAVARGITRPVEALAKVAAALGRGEAIPAASTGLRATDDVMAALQAASLALREREDELRESERRLTLALEAGGLGTWDMDAATWAGRWTARQAMLIGQPPAVTELPAEEWKALVHPEDLPRVVAALEDAIAGKERYRAEFRVRQPDGSMRWLANEGMVLRDDEGKPLRVVGVAQDITERKHAEEALRASEARLRATVDSAPAGIAEADAGGRIIRANHRFHEITGYGAELIGKRFTEFTHPDDVDPARYRRLFAGEVPSYRVDVRYLRPDGVVVWLDIFATLVPDGGGTPFSMAIVQDITERKQAEDALRDSEARFRTMLEVLPHIAFVLRPDGSTEYHNRRFAEYFGTEAADLASRVALIHPEDRPRLVAAREAGIAAGTEYAAEMRVRRHDGVYRWHAAQLRPLRRDGKIVAWLGTSVDIDDIRRMNETLEARVRERTQELEKAEETLRQSQKLEAIGQLTGGVAHDFNNLLTALSGNLDLLERQVRGDAARRLIEAAHRAIERGARLTQSLLAFARRQSLHPETVNANRLIKEFGELLRRAAGDHVEVQLMLSPTLDPCRIDAAQFQAALLNLVVNARDAVPASGGRISIETENVTVDEREAALDPETQPGAFVCIKVSDTGSGMTQEVMTRAFEPFFTTKDIGKGSGLGLSQVYGFATQSGGFVRLASELGVGTTVRLYLPRSQDGAAAEQQRSADTAPSARAGRAETVLVVEDDADVRDTVAESLRALGYGVVAAEDGVAALALLERGVRADLLFSDLSMPRGLAGDELARRALRLRRGLKVLLTSGYAAALSGSPSQDFAILAKPYRHDDFARAIRAALDA